MTIAIIGRQWFIIMSLAPGVRTPDVLRALPGVPSSASCKHGVDGIAFDPTTNTIIVPDSSEGVVYRMSLDGKTFTSLASGIVRPVGASVDSQRNIYVADECEGAIWRITPDGKTTRIGGFGMPDGVALDGYGNVLVIDLRPAIHALIRLNPTTGKRVTLARQGYIEPQGLITDAQRNIYVSVEADATRVGQILRNLLHNAIRHTTVGGRISVGAMTTEQVVQASVQDSGEGIATVHLPYVFERFYRVDASRSRQTGGTGLGLAIMKQLVQAHGGQVIVESSPGCGARFCFTLPCAIPFTPRSQ